MKSDQIPIGKPVDPGPEPRDIDNIWISERALVKSCESFLGGLGCEKFSDKSMARSVHTDMPWISFDGCLWYVRTFLIEGYNEQRKRLH